MNFQDIIKNRFLEEFTDISFNDVLIAILLSCVLGVFIVMVYKFTFSGVVFNRSFAVGLTLLPMITAVIVLCISSNIVLSLGMVGALSIVRFRTAVKEVMDTIFMFWAIAVGIVTGAGFIMISIVSTVLIGVLFFFIHHAGNFLEKTGFLGSSGYMVVIVYDRRVAAKLNGALDSLPKYRLKSKSQNGDFEELVIELRLSSKDIEYLNKLGTMPGIEELNMVSYSGNTLL